VPAIQPQELPILYVYDGAIFIEALALPATLDSLVDTGQMRPALVAFIDAGDRHDDYEPGSFFRSLFTTEIVPAIEHRYGIVRDRRALLGVSRSTVGALDACANSGLAFDGCVLLAPAIPGKAFPSVLPVAGRTTRFLIAAGTYDLPLVYDARALRLELERRGLSVQYVESPEGHNHTAFRARLPALLKALYPSAEPPTRF
jgi:enterochelin esterase family protein